MLVTIVVITRNRAQSLLRCLQSIVVQDYKAVELIVVDNDSTDNTRQLVETDYPSAVFLPQETNLGVPGGRNVGIYHAKGDVCICVDDDAELIDNDCVSKCVEYFSKDEKLACLSLRIVDEQDRIIRKLIPRRDRKVITEDTMGAMFSGTGFAMRRSAFIEIGGFWETLGPYFGEEPDLSFRLLDNGYNILHTPHIKVRHCESHMERPKGRRIYCGTRNTPWLALRSLPWYSVVSLTIFSWSYFLILSVFHKQSHDFFAGAVASIRYMPTIYRKRSPINKHTRRLLWQYSGLIFY